MKQFIQGPPDKFGNTKTVNIKNCSSIAFEHGTDRFKEKYWKIIFNYNYSVSLNKNIDKKIPDYTYFRFPNEEEYNKIRDKLNVLINEHKWLAPKIKGKVSRIINPDNISFLAVDPGKFRVILNLNNSISYFNDYRRLSSDFVYIDFETEEEFLSEYEYIKDQLDQHIL